MLNNRAEKSGWREVLEFIGDLDGKVIGDIGAGGGFFTFKFSDAVGKQGTVYAIDTDKHKLNFIESTIKRETLTNVQTIYCSEKEMPLNQNSVDVFFSRNSFHHIESPLEYFSGLRNILKEQGQIVIIDYKKTDTFNFINLFGHCSSERNILFVLEKSGYRHTKSLAIAKNQTCNLFLKK